MTNKSGSGAFRIMRIIFFFLLTFMMLAQVSVEAKRVALVIGNDRYEGLPDLNNAQKDAKDMAAKLKRLGFKVILKTNASRRHFGKALNEFENALVGADAGLVFYAGHGIQAEGKNYLIPSDAEIESEEDLRYEAIDANDFLHAMKVAGADVNVVILDACRDNPLPKRSRSVGRGLAVTEVPRGVKGVAMLYSAGPGETAADGKRGRNSVFTGALLKAMTKPGLTIEQVFKETARNVNSRTGGKQTPWINASLTGDFYFKPGAPSLKNENVSNSNQAMEIAFWQSVEKNDDPDLYEAYLEQFPDGSFAALARAKIKSLTKKQVASKVQAEKTPRFVVELLDQTMWVRTSNGINVRSGPATSYGKVAKLAGDSQVKISGSVKNSDWLQVALNDAQVGYVYKKLLSSKRIEAPIKTEPQIQKNVAKQRHLIGSVERVYSDLGFITVVPQRGVRLKMGQKIVVTINNTKTPFKVARKKGAVYSAVSLGGQFPQSGSQVYSK